MFKVCSLRIWSFLQSYYNLLTSYIQNLFFDPRLWPEGSCELGFVRFLGIGSLVFSETQHGVRDLCGAVRDRAWFCLQNVENGPKIRFLKLLQNLVIDIFWIWSIKKVYITCCLLVQIRYLKKAGSWDMGQNALGQLDCRIFKSTIFPGQNYEKAKFCACWHRFMIIKRWLKNIGVSMVKNGWGHSSLRTLKLAVSQEGINEINWLFGVSIKIQESQKLL